jgi:hypothetical protein
MVALSAVALAAAMVVMWWVFSSSESSTAALVFLSGWLVGIPVSTVLVAVARWRANRAPGGGSGLDPAAARLR